MKRTFYREKVNSFFFKQFVLNRSMRNEWLLGGKISISLVSKICVEFAEEDKYTAGSKLVPGFVRFQRNLWVSSVIFSILYILFTTILTTTQIRAQINNIHYLILLKFYFKKNANDFLKFLLLIPS